MTYSEVRDILDRYERAILDYKARGLRGVVDTEAGDTYHYKLGRALVHALEMVPKMRAMLDELECMDTDPDGAVEHWTKLRDKLMRWLGFLQGVLWCDGMYSLDELKAHNRGPDHASDAA
jgi:hypothetical protein